MTETTTGGMIGCAHCGNHHFGACPRIQAIEYYENGTIRCVAYHLPQRALAWAIPPRSSPEWRHTRDRLLDVPKTVSDDPADWLAYFDRLRDAMEDELEP